MGALPEIKIFTFLYILDLKTTVFVMLSLSALRIVRPQSFLDLLFSQLLVSWHRRLEFLFLRLIYMFIADDPTFSSGYTIRTWANIHSLSCSPLLPSHLSSLVFPLLQHDPHPGAGFSVCHDRDSHHGHHGPVARLEVLTLHVSLPCLHFSCLPVLWHV